MNYIDKCIKLIHKIIIYFQILSKEIYSIKKCNEKDSED